MLVVEPLAADTDYGASAAEEDKLAAPAELVAVVAAAAIGTDEWMYLE